jgi:hypothetical protein
MPPRLLLLPSRFRLGPPPAWLRPTPPQPAPFQATARPPPPPPFDRATRSSQCLDPFDRATRSTPARRPLSPPDWRARRSMRCRRMAPIQPFHQGLRPRPPPEAGKCRWWVTECAGGRRQCRSGRGRGAGRKARNAGAQRSMEAHRTGHDLIVSPLFQIHRRLRKLVGGRLHRTRRRVPLLLLWGPSSCAAERRPVRLRFIYHRRACPLVHRAQQVCRRRH